MATTQPSVFVGSSSEGLEIAEAIQRRLQKDADIDLWDQATFDLSSVTMDALLERCRSADFAVFVLTADDVKIKREKPTAAARDNVIFELGLFAGVLGRKRCFIVCDEAQNIDIPSDLAGITLAKFRRQASGNLDASLGGTSSSIKIAMGNLKPRRKLSQTEFSAIEETNAFCARLTGLWWERIYPEDASALSFVRVEPDAPTNTVTMRGSAYDTDGTRFARWKSTGISIDTGKRKLSYIWEGYLTKEPNKSFEGYGLIEFDESTEAFVSGSGYFFDANVADLKTNRRKSIEFRRCADAKEIDTMNGQNSQSIGALVLEKLKAW